MNRYFLIILYIIISYCVDAQENKIVNDFHIKTGLGIEYEIKRRISISTCYQSILKRDAKEFDEYYFNVEAKYKAFSFFHIGSGYRYTWNKGNKSKIWQENNRVNIDFLVRKKIKPYRLSYRFRIENTSSGSKINFRNDSIEASFIRNRVKILCRVPKTKIYPYVSVEHYSRYSGYGRINNKLKTIIAIESKLKNIGVIKLGYQNMRELTKIYPYKINTVFIKYTYSL